MANQNITTIQQYYADLQRNGRLLDHQFQISITRAGFDDIQLYGQSTTIPERSIETAELKFYGQTLEIPTVLDEGRRWSVELNTDSDNDYYNNFLQWQEDYASWKRSGGGYKGVTDISGYIDLMNNNMSKVVDTFCLKGLVPLKVGQINLDHSSTGIATFEVTFLFQYKYNSKRSSDPLR